MGEEELKDKRDGSSPSSIKGFSPSTCLHPSPQIKIIVGEREI